jgi:hypothetical protein
VDDAIDEGGGDQASPMISPRASKPRLTMIEPRS